LRWLLQRRLILRGDASRKLAFGHRRREAQEQANGRACKQSVHGFAPCELLTRVDARERDEPSRRLSGQRLHDSIVPPIGLSARFPAAGEWLSYTTPKWRS
jgi:hypothetical protein